jgi:kynureninase
MSITGSGATSSALPTRADVDAMDRADPLRHVRELFVLPDGMIYLDGNSLGPVTHGVLAAVEKTAREEWGRDLIQSYNSAGWWQLPVTVGNKIGALIGADKGETVACDTTSANIYKLLHVALDLRPGRTVMVAEGKGFPTDLYIAEGVLAHRPGTSMRLEGVDAETIEALIDETVAVVLVNQVDYRSGVRRDMAALTKRAHDAGALIIWDLCHSAGAMPIALNAAHVDFAVGCGYKYLNGGPGAPAFVFCATRHLPHVKQPLSGWWGHATPFAFDAQYTPDQGIRRFLCGSQPILSMRALDAALDVWQGLDLQTVRTKSVALTELFIQLVEAHCTTYGVKLVSPREADVRGSQVSFAHPNGYPIVQNLIARGVVGDFRMPDRMRFGFAPLYVRYRDVFDAAEILRDILATQSWKQPEHSVRAEVT